ncbi:hypothetical protein H257_14684 [Aphanomyces astaci]|uniref:Uncharacterized protein n=1 Tax=Aphanomyces astaci TaxID=112090 RepID=W4FQA9_APHAT|nr:hypothetical protein H257_14684 [Aphanomyces astaci]ETV69660.1 hypothetical protein H257_14684 [Aphanomyces astaci]|eukprot:XP_009840876.1 hypothetical protein H257_14684 [Aphanomyces astaci]
MGTSKTGNKYLLVVKCDASKMVWLIPALKATAIFVKDCVLQWSSCLARATSESVLRVSL